MRGRGTNPRPRCEVRLWSHTRPLERPLRSAANGVGRIRDRAFGCAYERCPCDRLAHRRRTDPAGAGRRTGSRRGPLSDRLARFRDHSTTIARRSSTSRAARTPSSARCCARRIEPTAVAGVIFFNNVGYLGMCGHGTIGLVASLAHLGPVQPGMIESRRRSARSTPRCTRTARSRLPTCPAFASASRSSCDVPGVGDVRGDIAWGGNWFFLVEQPRAAHRPANVDALTDFTWRVRAGRQCRRATRKSITSSCSARRAARAARTAATSCCARARPTIARRAAPARAPSSRASPPTASCAEGEVWVQESVIGSVFAARYRWCDRSTGEIAPVHHAARRT